MTIDDTNALSDAEAKYFDTKGQADLPLPVEADTAVETVEKAPVEKQPEAKAEPEKKADAEKAPPQIEVVNENDVSDGDEPDGRKYVRVGALRKEREKAKQFRAQVEQERQARVALEQRLKALEQPQREPEPVEVVQQTAAELAQIKRALGENAAKQQFIGTYQQKAQEFMAGTDDEPGVPDFPDAYKHALGVRRTMYTDSGFSPEEVNRLLESEEAAIVERAMMNGENPARAIYKIAKTLGYAPKQAKVAEEAEDPAVKKQAETVDKTLAAAKHLEKIAKGMDKNKSLSGGGGSNDAPSLEELIDMDEAEFTKHTSGKKFRALMGG